MPAWPPCSRSARSARGAAAWEKTWNADGRLPSAKFGNQGAGLYARRQLRSGSQAWAGSQETVNQHLPADTAFWLIPDFVVSCFAPPEIFGGSLELQGDSRWRIHVLELSISQAPKKRVRLLLARRP